MCELYRTPGGRDLSIGWDLNREWVYILRFTYSFRIEQPPPVPVTQPRCQNLAQSEGMRLAGCSWSSEVMSLSASLVAMVKCSVGRNPSNSLFAIGNCRLEAAFQARKNRYTT